MLKGVTLVDAIIEQVNRYTVTIAGNVYYDFKYESEWEGMLKFRGTRPGETHLTVIVFRQGTPFSNIFLEIFGGSDAEPHTFTIAKASPSLLASTK